MLEGSGLAPRFLAHVHENRRIIGFALKEVEGRPASLQYLSGCETALRTLHELGLAYGDGDRYSFLVTKAGAKLLDRKHPREDVRAALMSKELGHFRTELIDESRRGGSSMLHGDNN